jgi:hypothetical protein
MDNGLIYMVTEKYTASVLVPNSCRANGIIAGVIDNIFEIEIAE